MVGRFLTQSGRSFAAASDNSTVTEILLSIHDFSLTYLHVKTTTVHLITDLVLLYAWIVLHVTYV